MKKNLHPELHLVKFICSCWNIIETLSTIKDNELRIEICSSCHPFYTWEQKLLKTWAVDKFYARMKKTNNMQKK